MFQEYKSLSEEELDTKMTDVLKKMNMAHSMGLDDAVDQLQGILEMLQFELTERLERQRFDIISGRTPESLVVGEDRDDPDDE
jgi:hypothetical protein